MRTYLDFEKPIAEIDARLERLSEADAATQANEEPRLQARLDRAMRQAYRRLSVWQVVQVARHPNRPGPPSFQRELTDPFVPLAGDRLVGDDPGLVAGIGRLCGYSAIVLATNRAVPTGGPEAQGFRKAERLIRMADRMGMPLVIFVDLSHTAPADTPRATAMAGCVEAAFELRAPSVSIVVGEAVGSEAHALTIADRVLMLEHAVAYPASPEAVASDLWQDPGQAKAAAEALKPRADDLMTFGLIDGIIPEPAGAAHRDPEAAIKMAGEAVAGALEELIGVSGRDLRRQRRDRQHARAVVELPGAEQA